jgi:hypothetical protein
VFRNHLDILIYFRNFYNAAPPGADGTVVALTSLQRWPAGLMPGSSIRRFLSPFRGSCSTRSGGIAARVASTSATAIGSMIQSDAQIWTAKQGCYVIAFH